MKWRGLRFPQNTNKSPFCTWAGDVLSGMLQRKQDIREQASP